MKRRSITDNTKDIKNVNIKDKITDMLDLPKEIVLDLPLISMIGKEEVTIENYKGLIEYSEGRIRVNTSIGVLKIEGKNLFFKQITTEYVFIIGTIISVEYLL